MVAKVKAETHALARELETYKGLLAKLTQEEGRFAVIAEDKLLGIYDTYADALAAGYRERQLKPFLVKQISAHEVVANYTRDIFPSCRTLPI